MCLYFKFNFPAKNHRENKENLGTDNGFFQHNMVVTKGTNTSYYSGF